MNNSKEQTGKEVKSAVEGLFIRHNVKDFFVQNDENDFPMFFSDIIHLQYVDELKELQQRIVEFESELKRKDEALLQIDQMSDPGDAFTAVIRMKGIANKALKPKTDEK